MHPAVPVLLFAPAIAILLTLGVERVGGVAAVAWVLGGYVFWTLTEYWMHRIVFHFEPEDGIGARLHWIIHGVHHDHPNDPMRLVMPPSVSVPLAVAFYLLFVLVLGGTIAPGVRGGLPRGLPDLRHDPLPRAPPHAAHPRGAAAARAAHAPPLPGRHPGLRRERPVVGSRLRHRAEAHRGAVGRPTVRRAGVCPARAVGLASLSGVHLKRVIPCLDVDAGRVVKGTNFVDIRDAGDPVELAAHYDAEGADELVFLDITATHEKRDTIVELARRTADDVFIPFTIGGGIRSVARRAGGARRGRRQGRRSTPPRSPARS